MSSTASETDRLPDYSEEILEEIGITLSLTPPGEWGQLALCPGPYGCPPWGHERSGVTEGGEEMFCSECRIIRLYRPL